MKEYRTAKPHKK